jgi:hypothetical protein
LLFLLSAGGIVSFICEQLLKEQQKYDDMVSDLTDQIERLLPFAKQALEELVYDDTELLEGAVRRLCNLVMEAAEFICDYVKKAPTSMYSFTTIYLSLLNNPREDSQKSHIPRRPREDQRFTSELQDIKGGFRSSSGRRIT